MSRRARKGYTLIEVMTAVAVMIVASTGFIMLQGAGTRAVILARERTIATSIAQRWVDRLRRESIAWTAAGPALTPNLSQPFSTPFLANATFTGARETAYVNEFGDDITSTDARFYVALTTTAVHTDASGLTDAIRVDIDVFWLRSPQGVHGDTATDTLDTDGDPLSFRTRWSTDGHVLHAYATTVVMPGGGVL